MNLNASLACSLAIFAWTIAPAPAQIDINAGDGSQVKIGPGGVFIKSGGSVVKVRSTNVKVDQILEGGGQTRVNVGAGAGVKSSGSTVKVSPASVNVEGDDAGAARARVKPKVRHRTVVVHTKAAHPAAAKAEIRTLVKPTDQSAASPLLPGNSAKPRNYAITSNNSEVSFTCNGDSCTIGSNNNTVALHGNCSKLSIIGNNNEVTCDAVEAVSIAGSNNTVTWRAGLRPPTLSVTGNNNETGEASLSK